jgi:hypothetical protein
VVSIVAFFDLPLAPGATSADALGAGFACVDVTDWEVSEPHPARAAKPATTPNQADLRNHTIGLQKRFIGAISPEPVME